MNTWSQNIPIDMLRPNTNSKLVPLRILSFPKPSVQVLRKASSSSLKVQSGEVYFKLYIDHVLYFLGISGRVKLAPKVKATDTSSKEVLTPWCLLSHILPRINLLLTNLFISLILNLKLQPLKRRLPRRPLHPKALPKLQLRRGLSAPPRLRKKGCGLH